MKRPLGSVKIKLLLAFAAALTAITLLHTGLTAWLINRHGEADAFNRLSQQLVQLQDELQTTREALAAVAHEAARDDKNLSDLAIVYSEALTQNKEHDAIRGRALRLQKTVSLNRLQLILDSARLSSLAVYLDGELSHYVTRDEAGMSAWRGTTRTIINTTRTPDDASDLGDPQGWPARPPPVLVAPRTAHVDRLTTTCEFPADQLMAFRVVVPIQGVLRESFNETIAEHLAIATRESLRQSATDGPTPKIIGQFVFSKAFDRAFLQRAVTNTGVLLAVLSPDGRDRLALIDVHAPPQLLSVPQDPRINEQIVEIGDTSYYQAARRWRMEGDTAIILGGALSRAGTLADIRRTTIIVTAVAAVILSIGMALVYAWIGTLEKLIRNQTSQLEAANTELESFSYAVSHDLRAPLRSLDGFSRAMLEDYEAVLDPTGQDYLHRIRAASQRMGQLIDDMLNLARVSRVGIQRVPVDLSALARSVADELRHSDPARQADFVITPGLHVTGDPHLLLVLLENLLQNAWKFTSTRPTARIECGQVLHNGTSAYFVRDDGVGFDMTYAHKLFGPFQRLHTTAEFPGTGIGLATAQRVIHRHGGRVWAESQPDGGATFYFTLPDEAAITP